MREYCRGAPPPIPELEISLDAAPCGLMLRPTASHAFCSLCFDPLALGILLSDGEWLCTVCSSLTFEHGEQHEVAGMVGAHLAPRVTLFAQLDSQRRILPDELHALRGPQHQRALALLQSARVGDSLRFCGCIASVHVRGQLGTMLGYCARRQLLLLRLGAGGAIACMSMTSAEDALMLRELSDARSALHRRMLRQLLPLASYRTLQAAVAMVRAEHTMCMSALLAAAEVVLARLKGAASAPPPWPRTLVPLPSNVESLHEHV